MDKSRRKTEVYQAAITFMGVANRHRKSVTSIPDDTALYFLSVVPCPTGVFVSTLGSLAPREMTDAVIRKVETPPGCYPRVCNRLLSEHGAPEFGVRLDQSLDMYIRERMHRGSGGA